MRKPIFDVVEELRLWIANCGLSKEEIARGSRVDLSTIYRLVEGGDSRKKMGSALKRLCEYANIRLESAVQRGSIPRVVEDAVLASWDGSREHAARLARAIRTLGEVTRFR